LVVLTRRTVGAQRSDREDDLVAVGVNLDREGPLLTQGGGQRQGQEREHGRGLDGRSEGDASS
jgi:hypothetical protein